jgi:hypothetical protein
MKAIRTRYYGPTNTKGSRYMATDGDGNSVSVSTEYALNSDENHKLAAYRLMQKMKWPNELNGGGYQNNQFWTMLPRVDRSKPPAYETFFALLEAMQKLAD